MGPQTQSIDHTSAACRNCGQQLAGSYCHECGQKHVEGRLDTSALFSQLLEALTESDGTLWQTLRKLTRNPGKVALEYIEGGRARYLNPIRFLLVAFTIYLGLMVITGAQLDIASRAFVPVGTDAQDVDTLTFASTLTKIVASQMDLVILLVVPALTFFIRWQYWRSGRNYAETFTFVCFVFGLGYLYASLLVPVQYWLGLFSSAPKNLISLVLFVYGACTFFTMGWVKATLAGIVSAFIYLLTVTGITTLVAVVEIFLTDA